MFSWRVRRQLTVFLIFAVIFIGLGFFIIPKFLPEPTCFDNKKNQRELGVDCGGPCAPCELKNPRPLSIFWARVVLVRPNTYDVAAEFQNTNEVLASPGVEYEFSLFDNLGVIARRTGKTFVLPQERFHIVEANITTTREPTQVEVRILKVDWQYNKTEKPNLIVERRDYKVSEGGGSKQGVVEASIFNRSVTDFREAQVNFVVLDKDGNLLGANGVLVENLLANTRKTVKSIWPQEFPGTVASIEVEPRVNMFDQSVIIKPK